MFKKFTLTIYSLSFLFAFSGYSQWMQVSNGMGNITISALTIDGINMFAGGSASGVYYSSNSGTSWTQTSLNSQLVFALLNSGNNVLAGTFNAGTYYSTNNGLNWLQSTMGGNMTVWAYCYSGSNIFAGTFNPVPANMGIYKSKDNGVSWILAGANNREVRSIISSSGYIYAGTIDSGVFLSSNSGDNWIKSPLNNRNVRSLAVNGISVYAGCLNSQGVYISSNSGNNWIQSTLNNRDCNALGVQGSTVIAGTTANGVYVSNDSGANWLQRNEGLNHLTVYSLKIYNGYVYAGTGSGGVYRRPLNDLIGITQISGLIPEKYSLSQNYPNPFNPSTKIRFDIAGNTKKHTLLTVYDLLGREIAVLVNQTLKPGTYEFDFNASNLPSGVYCYALSAVDFSETKKMILIK